MGKKENLEFVEFDNSNEYLDTAKELSDYIKSLPLSLDQNDKLINMILKHVEVSRNDSFKQGIEFMFDTANNQDIEEQETVN